MAVSEYQVGNVIKVYMKNMKARAGSSEGEPPAGDAQEDSAVISQESIKKMLHGRAREQMTNRATKRNTRHEREGLPEKKAE